MTLFPLMHKVRSVREKLELPTWFTTLHSIKCEYSYEYKVDTDYRHECEWFEDVILKQSILAGYSYIPALGPLLCVCVDIFNEPPLIKGDEFNGWVEGVLNLLLMITSMTTVYFALMNIKVAFYISLAIFLGVSLKNVWNDTKDFNGKLKWNCKKAKKPSFIE